MEERYKLLLTVLRELSNAEVLDDLILAGSWCQFYYRILFDEAPEIPLIRTTDLDFLVPNPSKIKKSVDVAKLLNSLGFDNAFDYHTGLLKFVHPDLEIQFLTPALGRGKDGPYEIRKLNINAEGLRYMTVLRDYIFHMIYNDITIWLPEPEAYILHKILISQKRKITAKKDKDLMAAKNIGELCMRFENHGNRLKSIFSEMPKRWQKQTLIVLKKLSPELYSFLHD